MSNIKYASPEIIKNVLDSNCIILDVRTDMEHKGQQLDCPHHHIPLDELNADAFIKENKLKEDSQLYVLCHSGKRAERAAKMFHERGLKNIHVINGGIIACQECGVETRLDSTAPLSLERQVRIVAGMIVVLGSILALYFNLALLAIPLFVGCGLIFSGITNKCGMALILAKAPWNKI